MDMSNFMSMKLERWYCLTLTHLICWRSVVQQITCLSKKCWQVKLICTGGMRRSSCCLKISSGWEHWLEISHGEGNFSKPCFVYMQRAEAPSRRDGITNRSCSWFQLVAHSPVPLEQLVLQTRLMLQPVVRLQHHMELEEMGTDKTSHTNLLPTGPLLPDRGPPAAGILVSGAC